MPRLTQEQYNTLRAKGLQDDEIQSIASQKGYKMPDNRDFLQKAEDFVTTIFPGKRLGESIGTLAGFGVTAAKEKLGFLPEGSTEAFSLKASTPKQTVAETGEIALSMGALKGVGLAGNFSQRVMKMFGLGAGLGGAKAVAEGEDVGDAIGAGLKTGAVSAGIPVAGAGLRGIGGQIQQLPARFINSALGRKKADVLKDISQNKGDNFTKWVLESKKAAKTANTHLSETMDSITKLNNQIQTALSSALRKTGEKITIGRDAIIDDVVKLPEATGALLKRADVRGIIEKLAPQTKALLQKPSLTLEEANKLRQLLDRTLGDRAFLGGQLSSDKAVLMGFANALRETVKRKAPEGTRALYSELSNEIRFRDTLLERIAQKAGNQVLSFGDFVGGGLGGVMGKFIGDPVTGAVAGVATRRAIESTPVKFGTAKVINALTKAAPIIEALTPAQQTAILNLLADLFSPEDSPESSQ